MTGQVLIFDLNDLQLRQRYDRLFEECAGAFIQQSTYWAEVIKDLGPQPDVPTFLLYCEDGHDLAGLPLYLCRHRLGNSLSSVPHAGPLGGIFFREGLSGDQIERLYSCLIEQAQQMAHEHRCLALSFITNPFVADHELYQRLLTPTFTLENFTQYIPLDQFFTESGEVRLPDYHRRSNLSRNLAKARAAGFSVSNCVGDAELEAVYSLHAQRHADLGVAPLSFQMFLKICQILEPRRKSHWLLIKQGDAIASACLYIYHRQILDVLRLNMDWKYAAQAPNFLNTEHSLHWAFRQGIRTYNWQSSPSRDSGVFRYKQQWGSCEVPYYFVSKLYCEVDYIRALGLETLKTQYAGHFLVPYLAFEQGFEKAFFKK